MNGITTITTKGQVTVPKTVRQALKIRVGDKVSFTKIFPSQKKAVIKIISSDIVDELSGSLSPVVEEVSYKKARKEAGKLLVKKYRLKWQGQF